MCQSMTSNLTVTRMSKKGKAAFSSVSVVSLIFGRYHLNISEILVTPLSMWPVNKGFVYIFVPVGGGLFITVLMALHSKCSM